MYNISIYNKKKKKCTRARVFSKKITPSHTYNYDYVTAQYYYILLYYYKT